jgi:hypothetical protein
MSGELILFTCDNESLSVAPIDEAGVMRAGALEKSALIGKVTNPTEQAAAVEAQKALKRVLKLAEESRVEVKKPFLDFGRKIDETHGKFVFDVKVEELRLAKIVGDYQQVEAAKVRAAEALRVQELNDIERRRQEAILNAANDDEIDEIAARANEEAAAVPMVQSVKADGQIVKQDWTIEVVNPFLLAQAHPGCVKIEPRLTEIKALLKAGAKVSGIIATPIINSSVRVGREPLAITV